MIRIAERSMSFPRHEFYSVASAEDNRPPLPSWKRWLDVLCIILAMPVLLPLGFIIGCWIKLVSPGPVLFKQERVGYRTRPFMCLKFRTMHVNADTGVHKGHLQALMKSNRPMTKLDSKGDPRVIPGGVLIRSLGIDELPQLINVLRCEMSLVGPRPCIPYEYEQFSTEYRKRNDTPPGLTGLWQVNGKNKTTFEQMMAYDLRYVREKSLGMDIVILLRTVPAMLAQAWDVKMARRRARKAAEALEEANEAHPLTGRG